MGLEPGTRFDRYVIESLLGQGGMGRVYRARDEKLEREVALKVLRFDDRPYLWAGGAQRLLREARSAARLAHVNTIAVHDVGEFEGTPFIAMELVLGESLRALVGDASVPVEVRVRYLVDVARALAAAHDRGIIHRDIKPENVMVRRDGVVKVLDFGIARPLHGGLDTSGFVGGTAEQCYETWARESGLMGTPRYMAPEQLRGDTIDARADQFAWGVMAYELLTGRTPWPETTAPLGSTLVLAILGNAAIDETPLVRSCPPAVVGVVRRALCKDRTGRFASMSEIVDALQGPLSAPSLPESVAGVARSDTIGSTTHRRPWRSRAAWVGVLLVLALVSGAARLRWAPRASAVALPPTRDTAVTHGAVSFALSIQNPHRITVDDRCEEFPVFTPDGASVVYSAEVGDDEQIMVQSLADGAKRTLTRHRGWDMAPTVSPDGRWIAFLRGDDHELGTYVVDIEGRTAPRLIAPGGMRPSFSPDGTAVWAGNKKHPARYAFPSGEVTRTLESPLNCGGPHARELPDGRVIVAYPAADGIADAGIAEFSQSGTMTWLARLDADEVLAIAPGGRQVLGVQTTRGGNLELFAIPVGGGPLTPLPSSDLRPSKGLDFSRDGKKLAWSACRGLWLLGRFDAKGAFVPTGSSSWQESSAAPIGDTQSVAVISDAVGTASLWIHDRTGHDPPRMVVSGGERGLRENVDVSADGRTAVVEMAGAGLGVVRLDDPTLRPLTDNPSDERPHFMRDGRVTFTRRGPLGEQVFVVGLDGGEPRTLLELNTKDAAPSPVDDRVAYIAGAEPGEFVPMVVDLATGRKHQLSRNLRAGRYMSLAFSADGKRVAVVVGESRMVEVDPTTGTFLRQAEAGAMLQALRYVGDQLWAARTSYRGNIWIADAEVQDAR
jgi:serine/threonine-protein kinase